MQGLNDFSIMGTLIKKTKNGFIKAVIFIFGNHRAGERTVSRNSQRFLIISTTGIGDTLWGTPAIRALKETYPESYMCVLTSPAGYELLRENPYIDSLFTFKKGWGNFFSLPRLLKSLIQKRFEVVFIFHASDRLIFPLAYFMGAAKIIGYEGQCKDLDFILTQKIKYPDNIHGIEARLNLVNLLSAETPDKTISIYLTDKEREHAVDFLKNQVFNGDSLLVGFQPGAQKPFKCWPAQNFIELGNTLLKKFKCKIIITGNHQEKSLASLIASKIKGSISVAGSLSLRETAAIIERMNLFITNDTGPMHIAFALKTPTIALFCPTNPELCGPYHVENTIVIKKPQTCNPCIGKKCYNPLCMEQITPQEVISAASSLLER